MAIPCYLAMTGAEISKNTVLPPKIAWMACHFSPYGTGLSNLPETLPPGTLIILNDRTPVCGHDPLLIAEELGFLAEDTRAAGVLLDLQRRDEPETAPIVRQIVKALPCPVGVTPWYADGLDCPVFLPPVPLLTPVEAYLAPWQGRQIWLEAAPDALELTLTAEGCRRESLPPPVSETWPHREPSLHCHYRTEAEPDRIRFTLCRTSEDLETLRAAAAPLGAALVVGLYQEWKRANKI